MCFVAHGLGLEDFLNESYDDIDSLDMAVLLKRPVNYIKACPRAGLKIKGGI
jgi:hypothetical protein